MQSFEAVNEGISDESDLIDPDEISVGRVEQDTQTGRGRVSGLGSVPRVGEIELGAVSTKETFDLGDKVVEDSVRGTGSGGFVEETASESINREPYLLLELGVLRKISSICGCYGQKRDRRTSVKFWYHQCPAVDHERASLAKIPPVSSSGDSGMTSSSDTAP